MAASLTYPRELNIVVSKPEKTWGGVVQYDKGKAESGGKFVVKGQLNQPPALLLQTLAQLRARHAMRPSKVSEYITEAIGRSPMLEETGFTFQASPIASTVVPETALPLADTLQLSLTES